MSASPPPTVDVDPNLGLTSPREVFEKHVRSLVVAAKGPFNVLKFFVDGADVRTQLLTADEAGVLGRDEAQASGPVDELRLQQVQKFFEETEPYERGVVIINMTPFGVDAPAREGTPLHGLPIPSGGMATYRETLSQDELVVVIQNMGHDHETTIHGYIGVIGKMSQQLETHGELRDALLEEAESLKTAAEAADQQSKMNKMVADIFAARAEIAEKQRDELDEDSANAWSKVADLEAERDELDEDAANAWSKVSDLQAAISTQDPELLHRAFMGEYLSFVDHVDIIVRRLTEENEELRQAKQAEVQRLEQEKQTAVTEAESRQNRTIQELRDLVAVKQTMINKLSGGKKKTRGGKGGGGGGKGGGGGGKAR